MLNPIKQDKTKWSFFRRAGLILGPALLFTAIAVGMYSPKTSLVDSYVQLSGSAGTVIRCDYLWSIHKYKTYVLTAYHVVEGDKITKVIFPLFDKNGHQYRQKKYGGQVIVYNKKLDFAILLIYTDLYVRPITINISTLKLMDEIYLLGRPLNANVWITRGQIANMNVNNHIGYFGISAPVFLGNSGGPCVNLQGEQIGISIGMHNYNDGLLLTAVPHMGFCLSMRAIHKYYPREFRRYFESVKS